MEDQVLGFVVAVDVEPVTDVTIGKVGWFAPLAFSEGAAQPPVLFLFSQSLLSAGSVKKLQFIFFFSLWLLQWLA